MDDVSGVRPVGVARRDGRRAMQVRFVCPLCGGLVLRLYGGVWGPRGERVVDPVVGCRECLGLTYPSRAGHGTPRWALALLEAAGAGRDSVRVRAQRVVARSGRRSGR